MPLVSIDSSLYKTREIARVPAGYGDFHPSSFRLSACRAVALLIKVPVLRAPVLWQGERT